MKRTGIVAVLVLALALVVVAFQLFRNGEKVAAPVLSVSERTREIGVRKALGATRKNILLQFLIEALVLCMMGGVVGILAGSGGAVALSRLANWNMFVSPHAVLIALAFSIAVGLFFGIWPARRASLLDPIEALRYE